MKHLDHGEFRRLALEFVLGCAVLSLLSWGGIVLNVSLATACLLYMIVIVLFSMTGGIANAITLAIIAAIGLNYFFTEPRFSFQIGETEDIIAVITFVSTAFVITTLVRRARRLGETAALRDQLQLIIDTIPAVVWSNFPDGSAEFLNKRFLDYSGLTTEQGRGLAWMNILHPDDRATGWQTALTAGEPFEKEARLRSAAGDYRRFLLRFVPLRDRQDSLVKWYATSTDIEDLKRAEEGLRQRETYLREAQAELAHVNRVTTAGQLAASIAHEVAQPVAASVTNANAALRWLAANPPALEEAGNALGRIVRDGRRASDIIGRIRALVRKVPPRKDEVDLNEMIVEVLALTRSELRRNGISVKTDLADNLPSVPGDRVQLQQVLLNLILNAIEAMHDVNPGQRELSVVTHEDAGSLRVAVKDSGPGLSPEQLDRLFDAFYTTKPDGMGMGLSICRSIITAHGGLISAEANEGQGATFQFTLARETAADSALNR